MPRTLRIAAAQMGATNRTDTRPHTLSRMISLLDHAASLGTQLIVYPELAFTTFFPRYLIHDPTELESWYERGDITKNEETKALFDRAREVGVDVCVGFGESEEGPGGKHFNTCVYYCAKTGSILAKYRKIHLPGTVEPFDDPKAINQLEKRYFLPGDLGFEAFRAPSLLTEEEAAPIMGMLICNDRRWSESWRVLGLQGVEVVLCGYNTPSYAPHLWGRFDLSPTESASLALFQHKLSMQAHSYTNACYSVSAARAGLDDGEFHLIGGSCVVDPEGRIVAEAKGEGDEVVFAEVDLGVCKQGKTTTFDFARHRRVEHYGRILGQTGVVEPPLV
ncbi:N-carbamoyl-D-amino acid hydrolase [Saitoella complicata NRRL Y-17804]|uniref:N-carbamoyl-D-amino acid hydrolase n=1 Tax=Saitoella complicata (strain BCRC 22490 / CBS 7301 / JCM 7358 / NBRC 10748 / NRRL Y-17804) TaxID=698492 RepID=UPI000867ED00|nr:N-carbamoyl-D-amino acid hydrolase [Saitoella complicata NRRL Y-17804]ODQ53098.1 N-carbamoyl-D-amino acid hydrolase [Saitoella complicata NRRL Y-17804]